MKKVFADSCYWIALLNPKDQLHQTAQEVSVKFDEYHIVTSEMILIEMLNGLSHYGQMVREKAVRCITHLYQNPKVTIIPLTSNQFRCAIKRYEAMTDKEWGITDYASFDVMEENSIFEALTYDKHFVQAGFTSLLRR